MYACVQVPMRSEGASNALELRFIGKLSAAQLCVLGTRPMSSAGAAYTVNSEPLLLEYMLSTSIKNNSKLGRGGAHL